MPTFDEMLQLVRTGPQQAANMLHQAATEIPILRKLATNSGGSSLPGRGLEMSMKPALEDFHRYDSAPVSFVGFNTSPATAVGLAITSTFGAAQAGAAIDLYASIPGVAEPGFIILDSKPSWAIGAGGLGGSISWVVDTLRWGTGTAPNLQTPYVAVSGGYGPDDGWSIKNRLYTYKPMAGRSFNTGSTGVVIHLRVYPIGPIPVNTVVPFPGAWFTAATPDACTLLQSMQTFDASNFGGVNPRLWYKGTAGRKATLRETLGNKLGLAIRAAFPGGVDAPRDVPR